ncbi:MAG: hypothetical protein Q8L84_15300, partial [Hyphomonas sp.]|nr:hypothetical protein [Hyphomonas sp.]
ALVFGFAVLFRTTRETVLPAGITLNLPDLLTLDPLALAIAAAAAIALIRFKANILLVVLACALAGLVRLILPAAA